MDAGLESPQIKSGDRTAPEARQSLPDRSMTVIGGAEVSF
jgi:hypothetical protein